MSNVDAVRCRHCMRPFKQHGEGMKCLFEASTFGEPEDLRVALMKDINSERLERSALERTWGDVWDTAQAQDAFQIKSFLAPFVSAVRRADGVEGMLMFQHLPRYYFGFQPE